MNAITVTLAFSISLLAGLAAADDWKPNFSETCGDITWEGYNSSPLLIATCEKNGHNRTSDLDLSSCMGVDQSNGYLTGLQNGNFSWPESTCICGSDFGESSGYMLNCSCTTGTSGGKGVDTIFDLNQVVGNTGGTLYCYDTIGNNF